MEKIQKMIHRNDENDKTYEYFRYYTGQPDGIGHRHVSKLLLEQQKVGSKKEEGKQ
jgi:hypothetical protein